MKKELKKKIIDKAKKDSDKVIKMLGGKKAIKAFLTADYYDFLLKGTMKHKDYVYIQKFRKEIRKVWENLTMPKEQLIIILSEELERMEKSDEPTSAMRLLEKNH